MFSFISFLLKQFPFNGMPYQLIYLWKESQYFSVKTHCDFEHFALANISLHGLKCHRDHCMERKTLVILACRCIYGEQQTRWMQSCFLYWSQLGRHFPSMCRSLHILSMCTTKSSQSGDIHVRGRAALSAALGAKTYKKRAERKRCAGTQLQQEN